MTWRCPWWSVGAIKTFRAKAQRLINTITSGTPVEQVRKTKSKISCSQYRTGPLVGVSTPGGYSFFSLHRVSALFSTENLFFFPLRFALCVSLRRSNAEHLLALRRWPVTCLFRVSVEKLSTKKSWQVQKQLGNKQTKNKTRNEADWLRRSCAWRWPSPCATWKMSSTDMNEVKKIFSQNPVS